ncbi:hypothetical protein [Sulfitobacter dubius]|uniref:hypothetical protein n=1 Tax=Sulfitobacter dubius TaxID=218673 RepID=UPI002943DEE0|nr:hypothetical protein [Sulfitobacter dubius]WOI30065.1 hypothetical protein R1T39_05000 [Sulfitobacter dubius]
MYKFSTTTAYVVVMTPPHFSDQPSILGCTWGTLMSEHGKRKDLERLGAPAYIVETKPFNPVLADFDSRTPRILARIRQHVAQSNGGDAA